VVTGLHLPVYKSFIDLSIGLVGYSSACPKIVLRIDYVDKTLMLVCNAVRWSMTQNWYHMQDSWMCFGLTTIPHIYLAKALMLVLNNINMYFCLSLLLALEGMYSHDNWQLDPRSFFDYLVYVREDSAWKICADHSWIFLSDYTTGLHHAKAWFNFLLWLMMSFFEVLAERHAMFASMFLSTLLWVVVYCSICFSGPVIQQFACVNQQIRIC
jgi:hypothetical protein